AYCISNPLKYKDPTGCEWEPTETTGGTLPNTSYSPYNNYYLLPSTTNTSYNFASTYNYTTNWNNGYCTTTYTYTYSITTSEGASVASFTCTNSYSYVQPFSASSVIQGLHNAILSQENIFNSNGNNYIYGIKSSVDALQNIDFANKYSIQQDYGASLYLPTNQEFDFSFAFNNLNNYLGGISTGQKDLKGYTYGSNGKFYASGWRGNQWVSTSNVAEYGRMLGRGTIGVGLALTVYDAWNAYDNGGSDAVYKSLSKSAGSWAGAWIGGTYGSQIGFAIGGPLGGIIGGGIGGLFCGIAGYYGADWLYDYYW
ncbi:MAG: hypothetical protein PUG15_09095, partial [Bacteroidales bacterium]|nr:hypothetical protein [Bacteroidales bacterium]